MTDAHHADAERSPSGDGADTAPPSPERALLTLWSALREATLALGEQALTQQNEAALRADAVVAAGVGRLKDQLSKAPPPKDPHHVHLSTAGDGPHASEATMSENTDNDDAGAAPNGNPGDRPNAAPPRNGADAAPLEPEELLERLRAALAGHGGEPYQYGGINQQIESAVKQSNEAVLAAAGEFAYGHRAATDAFAAGLRNVSDAQHRQNLQTLQAAALAVCLDAMLKQPDQADEYAGLLEAIKHIV
ncbi:hypothetical protein [Lysobacter enzymogenes]|uniref:hypothetical protein n=1 Tax=Lysobacter enzymogenes TaxID=69 RepID=UPI001A95F848|nr:hypothetical protein [Lysobacter enzymogenes]QQP95782.1 hypothetical protein JHW38_21555 [Lysobacter enzymogenes]